MPNCCSWLSRLQYPFGELTTHSQHPISSAATLAGPRMNQFLGITSFVCYQWLYIYVTVNGCIHSIQQQASDCLKEHTQRIRTENHQLRSELQRLIETTNDLQLQKKHLEKQYQALLREHQYNQDLLQMRGSAFRNLEGSSEFNFSGAGTMSAGINLPEISRAAIRR